MAKKIKQKKDNLDTLSKRLSFLLEQSGIKQSHLATKLGIKPQSIYQLCKSNTERSKYTPKIAEILNVNEKWLEKGEGQHDDKKECVIEKNGSYTSIPVFVSEQLKKITNLSDIQKLTPVETFLSSKVFKKQSFGFYLRDNHLSPRFKRGDLIIIEPAVEIKNGSLGLIYSKKMDDIIFCYLFHIQKMEQLIAFLPDEEIGGFIINSEDIIFGVAKELTKTISN